MLGILPFSNSDEREGIKNVANVTILITLTTLSNWPHLFIPQQYKNAL